jgi:hypothetical protein
MGPDEHRNGLSSKGLLKGSKQAATILFNPPGALVLVDSQQKIGEKWNKPFMIMYMAIL